MRKIYSLLLLAVMFIAGTSVVKAEKRYGIVGGNIDLGTALSTTDLAAGKQFVMQSGAEGDAVSDFIRGLGKSTFLTEANVFELVATGEENADGFPIYNLKRSFTNEYLADGSFSYVESQARAWKFVVKDVANVVATEDLELDPSESPVEDWTSTTTYGGGSQSQLIFVDAKCVADTSVTKKDNVKFLCSNGRGKAPVFGSSLATNTWELFEIEELTGTAYLEDAMMEIFPDGNAELYNPGTEPGQISEELYAELTGSFDAVQAMIAEGEEDQAKCEAAVERCKKAIEAAKNGAVKVHEGYYFFKGSRNENNATYDDGEGLHWTYGQEWVKPEVLDMENAKYVWYLKPNMKDGKEDGSYYIQNFYTKRYIGVVHERGAFVKTTIEAEEPYLIYPQDKEHFVIESTSLIKNPAIGYPNDGSPALTALHCPADHNNVVVWTTDAPASGWVFLNVDKSEIDALEGQVAQDKLNKELEKVYKQAKADYDKGFCFFDGNPNGLLDFEDDGTPKGLVKSADKISTNRQEASEGPLENILNNSIASGDFFHTDWQRAVNADQLPYIQIDLGKAVDHIIVKMWARLNGNELFVRDLPGIVNIWVSATPEDSASWKKIGQTTTNVAWNYPEMDENGQATGRFYNTKAVAQLDANLGAPYQYVRLENERKYDKRNSTAAIDTANTFFNMAEIRVFEHKYIAEKSMIEVVDKAVRAEFEAAMNTAKELIENKKATEESIKNLEAAYKKFLDNYPDPEIVKRALANAKARHDAAAEDDAQLGYYKTGAKAELKAVLDEVEAKVKDVMSLDEVKACKAQIDAAMKAFNAKLNKPADGYYYLKSETTSEQKGSAINAFFYASGNSAQVKWRTSTDTELTLEYLPQYIWKLTNKPEGVVLQNVLTGEYINNPKKNNAKIATSTVADTCTYGIQAAMEPGMFNLVLAENVFMNAEPASNKLVSWNEAGGADNSAFSFVPVEEQGTAYEGKLSWNVTPKAVQIMTLPVTITPDCGGTGEFYSVKGINGDKLELTTITEDIPAGTPFFFNETEGLTDMQVPTPGISSFEEFEGKTAKEALNVNGLYGTLAPIDSLHPGYGILFNGTLIDSKVGEGVNNNSGYIHPSVPRVTEAGDFQIAVDGKITAIHNVLNPTAPAIVNVYNLSGVKVRSNVKSTKDLNGLPAGIYIMGNKKVLVK